jgi:hypothetical protein
VRKEKLFPNKSAFILDSNIFSKDMAADCTTRRERAEATSTV